MIYRVDKGDRGRGLVYLNGVEVTHVINCDTTKGEITRYVLPKELEERRIYHVGPMEEKLEGLVEFKPFGVANG